MGLPNPDRSDKWTFLLQQRWHQWGLALQADDFTDMEVVTAILSKAQEETEEEAQEDIRSPDETL